MAQTASRWRAEGVFVRRDDEVSAMTWPQRFRHRVKNLFSTHPNAGNIQDVTRENGDVEATQSQMHQRQYRLEGRNINNVGIVRRILTLNGCLFSTGRRRSSGNGDVSSNQWLAMYLHWMFRVNFVFLFVVMCNIFFVLVILFSGFITLAGTMDRECVRVGSQAFGESGAPFADAFALSWTTMATVGYGITYPALTHQNTNRTNCFFINFICSLEALIGVLYSGFCGAVLFGKVLRIQSHAQVIFSDPLLIRYGSGLQSDSSASRERRGLGDEEKPTTQCPILEFRVVNRLFNEVGGEIMDASLNVVANINANDANWHQGESADGSNLALGNSTRDSRASNLRSLTSTASSDDGSGRETSLRPPMGQIGHSINGTTIDEDPSARIVNKFIFSKMAIEASQHPFFRRVWVARHVLNEESPIVKAKVRRQIRRHGGRWPEKLNNASGIRDSLKFNQILVSLTGVSNISAADVYAQKIYDFVDVNIGYQFVNILYRNSDGSLGVDTDLINDVREQTGGGGEPLVIE